MRIVAIEPVGGRADRVELRLDDGRAMQLARELVLRRGLGRDQDVPDAELAELQAEDLSWRAREAALHLLSVRARSRSELAGRLRRREFPPEVVERCVADLERSGLLDDGAFAQSFVRDRIRGRAQGPRRLAHELRARGVEAEDASAALREVLEAEEVTELDLARRAAARWKPRPGEERERARRRLYGFLARRGFGAEAVRTVLDESLP